MVKGKSPRIAVSQRDRWRGKSCLKPTSDAGEEFGHKFLQDYIKNSKKKKKKNPSTSFQSGRFPTTTPSTVEFADACELFPLSLTQIFICIKKCTRGERGTEPALRLFLFFKGERTKKKAKGKKNHSQMEKENPIILHLFSPIHTSETRLPTQNRFPTTKRNIRSNLLLTQHFLKCLSFLAGERGRGAKRQRRVCLSRSRGSRIREE